MVTNGTSLHAALMNARCSMPAAFSPGTKVAVSADGARVDFLTHLRGKPGGALRTTEVRGPIRGIAQHGIHRLLDQMCRRAEVLLPMAATKPVQQHGGREDKRRRIRPFLPLK